MESASVHSVKKLRYQQHMVEKI